MALGQHSEHGDHGDHCVCWSLPLSLGQHSDHLDRRASLLEPVVCACAQKKKGFWEHGLHSRGRHDQRSVQYSLAFQHARATRSSLFRKWKRAHSESALFQY